MLQLLEEQDDATKKENVASIDNEGNQLEVADYIDEIYQYYWTTEVLLLLLHFFFVFIYLYYIVFTLFFYVVYYLVDNGNLFLVNLIFHPTIWYI